MSICPTGKGPTLFCTDPLQRLCPLENRGLLPNAGIYGRLTERRQRTGQPPAALSQRLGGPRAPDRTAPRAPPAAMCFEHTQLATAQRAQSYPQNRMYARAERPHRPLGSERPVAAVTPGCSGCSSSLPLHYMTAATGSLRPVRSVQQPVQLRAQSQAISSRQSRQSEPSSSAPSSGPGH
jgi:hypothetical protein